MKKNNEMWQNSFDSLKQYLVDNNGNYPIWDTNLGRWVSRQRQHKTILTNDRLDKLNFIEFDWGKSTEDNQNRWDTNFEELKQYLINNDGKFPTKKTSLGMWVSTQRRNEKNNSISQDRLDKLNSFGFVWGETKDEIKNKWNVYFEELKQYLINNKGIYPTQSVFLGRWVGAQKQQNKNKILSRNRIDKLNSIGFDWVINFEKGVSSFSYEHLDGFNSIEIDRKQFHNLMWENCFDSLKQYLQDNNGNYPKWDTNLGRWVSTQRTNKISSLSQERIDKLNSIGFDWGETKEEIDKRWNDNFGELKQYLVNNNGEYPILIKCKLGYWVSTQRTNKFNNTLSQDRIHKLNSIGFKWGGPQNSVWEMNFNKLKQFLLENVGEYPSRESKLGNWVSNQRTKKNKSFLTQQRIDKLDSIGFIWGKSKDDN